MQQPKDQKQWMIKVNNELKYKLASNWTEREREQWRKRSIYKVAHAYLNKKAYKPQTVSFGPYHHDEAHLKPMEEHKHRALLHFLKRSKKSLDLYVRSLAGVVQDLKDSYDCLDKAWQENNDEFLQLMVLDGCFMLEILRTADTQSMDDYAQNDPIFSNHGKLYIMPHIKRDMLMLENQLPMLLLNRLLAVENDKAKHDEEFVNKLILNFFSPNLDPIKLRREKCLHVLDVYRKSLLWEDVYKKEDEGRARTVDCAGGGNDIIGSATELSEAGIKFKKSDTVSFRDITFSDGVLELPQIVVDDVTEPLFLNLTAFERFHVGSGKDVASYVFFMGKLIGGGRDVSVLDSVGIIQNSIGSEEAVANLFNSLSRDVTLDPECSLNRVHKEVTEYCKRWWSQWRAKIIHIHSTSPWAILSVIAAIVLFVPRHGSDRVTRKPQPKPLPQSQPKPRSQP